MSIRMKNGKWHYRFTIAHRRVEQSTGLEATKRNKPKAQEMETNHRLEIEQGRSGPSRSANVLLVDVLAHWLAFSTVHAQAPTAQCRRVAATSFKAFFGARVMQSIRSADIEDYLTWRLTGQPGIAPVKPVTARNNLAQLQVFFKWAQKRDFIKHNPCEGVLKPSAKDAIREHPVTPAEENIYFHHAHGDLRDLALIMLNQGMRPFEVLKLRPEHIDFERQTLTILKSKTLKGARTLKMAPETVSILHARCLLGKEWLFQGRSGHVRRLDATHDRLVRQLNLSFVLYDFRHTFATRAIESGMDVVALKDILGHSNLSTTLRYVHLSQAHKDSAMDRYIAHRENRLPNSSPHVQPPSQPRAVFTHPQLTNRTN